MVGENFTENMPFRHLREECSDRRNNKFKVSLRCLYDEYFQRTGKGQPGWNRVKEKNSREEQRSERTEEAISLAYSHYKA